MFNFIGYSFWNDTIKWIAIAFVYASILFSMRVSAALLDPAEVLYLAEINDYKTLCQLFDNQKSISIEQAQQFLLDTFVVIQSQYQSNISICELKNNILEIIKNYGIDENSFNKLEPILSVIIDRLIPNENIFSIILIKFF